MNEILKSDVPEKVEEINIVKITDMRNITEYLTTLSDRNVINYLDYIDQAREGAEDARKKFITGDYSSKTENEAAKDLLLAITRFEKEFPVAK